tara:strand:- start:8348 stop:8851 length:504 start_codon:yes stop_codon:yes gene_type:complete
MNSTITFFSKLTHWKEVLLLISPIISLLISMQAAILGLIILIGLDLLTGISRTLNEWGIKPNPLKKIFWKSIKSYLLRKTWRKAYEYGFGIVVVAVFETLILGSTSISLMDRNFSITELAIIIPSVIEVWSIFENLENISKRNILKRLIYLMPKGAQKFFIKDKHEL